MARGSAHRGACRACSVPERSVRATGHRISRSGPRGLDSYDNFYDESIVERVYGHLVGKFDVIND
ncbi:MAG: hypothetical protein IZT58_02645 [Actinobacteria bacterium]|jgi:hypothetical protein|nr:hypothetical protein [Actinomycetota bacterium]